MKTERKFKLGETGFWSSWFAKLLFTLISVKVWGLVACTIVSTWLLLIHSHHTPILIGDKIIEYGINGAQWVTFNTTIWALIFGMKEIFRISEQRDYSDRLIQQDNLDNKVTLAGMNQPEKAANTGTTVSGGFEIVGSEPDSL